MIETVFEGSVTLTYDASLKCESACFQLTHPNRSDLILNMRCTKTRGMVIRDSKTHLYGVTQSFVALWSIYHGLYVQFKLKHFIVIFVKFL